MTGSDETTSTSGLTWRNRSTRKAGVWNHICMPTFGRPTGTVRGPGRGGRRQLAQPTHHVVDLTAHAAEDPDLALGQRGSQLGFLAGEGDQLGRSLERDDRPRLSPVRPEQIAVVVVIEDHDGDQALLAHAGLDAGDSVETDLQLILRM